jgi:tyrosyl-tRNA synthetase
MGDIVLVIKFLKSSNEIKRINLQFQFVVAGLTIPLVTNEAGSKLGKTAGNAVWITPSKTSPYELYQFFMRVKDSEVEQLLKLFTFCSTDEISTIMEKQTVLMIELVKSLFPIISLKCPFQCRINRNLELLTVN